MRADRLISLLLILQNRGKLTAQRLADLLETSERTIYRDVDSLSAAGVPIYAEKGPGGGIALLESYRTTLTGLTTEEARALFMLTVPAPLEQLGLSQDLNSALLKLSASLPPSHQLAEERTRQRFFLDAVPWSDQAEPAPFLHLVQQALWQDQSLRLIYRTFFNTQVEICAQPLGLVAKASVWYLVYALDGAPVSCGCQTWWTPRSCQRPLPALSALTLPHFGEHGVRNRPPVCRSSQSFGFHLNWQMNCRGILVALFHETSPELNPMKGVGSNFHWLSSIFLQPASVSSVLAVRQK